MKKERKKIRKDYDQWRMDQLAEMNRCQEDPVYFIEKYLKQTLPNGKQIPVKFRPDQKIIIKAAMHGKSGFTEKEFQDLPQFLKKVILANENIPSTPKKD